MLIDLNTIKQGIESIKEMVASAGKTDYLYTLDGTLETIFQSSVYGSSDTTWRKIFQFIPEYSGVVQLTIKSPSARYYAILDWGKVLSVFYSGSSIYMQGEYLQILLKTSVGISTDITYGNGQITAVNAIISTAINKIEKSYTANETASFIVPVQKGLPIIGLSWGNATVGGNCVTEIKANKKAL